MTQTQGTQTRQFEQWSEDVTAVLTKLGKSFSELKDSTQRELKGQLDEIGRLRSDLKGLQNTHTERFAGLLHQNANPNDDYRGPFASRDQAAAFGHLVAAVAT